MLTPFRRVTAVVAMALTLGLVLGGATPANAETLRRHGAKTVKILPVVSMPPGAQLVGATVTVKKGRKTVARNKAYYKAKKGTYKATSTIVYRPLQPYTIPAADVFAECRVSTKEITSDRTEKRVMSSGVVYYAGQVTVRYTGECVDDLYIGGSSQRFTWTASWSDDDFVMTDDTTDTSAATRATLVVGVEKVHRVDDQSAVGGVLAGGVAELLDRLHRVLQQFGLP